MEKSDLLNEWNLVGFRQRWFKAARCLRTLKLIGLDNSLTFLDLERGLRFHRHFWRSGLDYYLMGKGGWMEGHLEDFMKAH